ncbi:MAG: hypothetical protein WBS24_04735 [Terriglobales bacterium]
MFLRSVLCMAGLSLLVLQGCAQTGASRTLHDAPAPVGGTAKLLAVYEPWFGHPQHIDVGYSSQDPITLKKQIIEAKQRGISGFVVDWYGDREPFIDKSYALLQSMAGDQNFSIAMMYDEGEKESDEATDDAMVAFEEFREKYLAPGARGREAYLTYQGRPVIFIFPKAGHTDWSRVRVETNKWGAPPLLIYEYRSTPFAAAFDGFYAWINPGKKGWAADGSNWGEDYLRDFYQTMRSKYPDKIAVGAAWSGFDDKKASWSLGRYMSRRCGQTWNDTTNLSHEYNSQPFLLIATWNDYEEGTAIEKGIGQCGAASGK